MLVLSRKAGQKITLDGSITVTVVEVTGKGVRLGIDAPKGVRILRESSWAGRTNLGLMTRRLIPTWKQSRRNGEKSPPLLSLRSSKTRPTAARHQQASQP